MVVAGCGQAADTPAARRTPTATPTAAASITITAPAAGTRTRSGRELSVRGTAAPGTTVLLSAGCTAPGCTGIARAAGDGRWRGVVRPRTARTTVEAATVSGDTSDRVRIRVTRARTVPIPSAVEAEPQTTPRPRATRVVMVGDSLAVGTRELLPAVLPEYTVSTDALTGRPLAAGMAIAARADTGGAILAISLFTNDDPRHVAELEAAVRASVRESRCAVWATIVRPPYMGVSYRAANARLQALAAELGPRLQLVPWAETIATQPELLEPDGVHATAAGYHRRAELYGDAIRNCS